MRRRSSKEVHRESDRRDNETEKFQLRRRRGRRAEEMKKRRRYGAEECNGRKLQELTKVRDGGKKKREETFFLFH